jgi:hypothetical protein
MSNSDKISKANNVKSIDSIYKDISIEFGDGLFPLIKLAFWVMRRVQQMHDLFSQKPAFSPIHMSISKALLFWHPIF